MYSSSLNVSLALGTRGKTLLGDGAIGTMLQAAGLALGEAPERWNLERPRAVARVHAAYAEAGAGWTTANTFGANRVRLAGAGLGERVAEVNAAAVTAARTGAPELPILGSLGPTTATDAEEWARAYREQAEALAAAEVDGFLVETVVRLGEGVNAVQTCVSLGVGPVVAAYTPGPEGDLLDGTPAETAAEAFFRAGAGAVGVNCGGGPETLLAPARRLVAAGLGPVLAAPNAGLPRVHDGRASYDLRPDGFARAAIQFQELGVRLFAGCCGTTPEHVRAAVRALKHSGSKS